MNISLVSLFGFLLTQRQQVIGIFQESQANLVSKSIKQLLADIEKVLNSEQEREYNEDNENDSSWEGNLSCVNIYRSSTTNSLGG